MWKLTACAARWWSGRPARRPACHAGRSYSTGRRQTDGVLSELSHTGRAHGIAVGVALDSGFGEFPAEARDWEVYQLLAVSEIQPVQQGLGMLIRQPGIQIVTGESRSHRQGEGAVVAVPGDVSFGRGHVVSGPRSPAESGCAPPSC